MILFIKYILSIVLLLFGGISIDSPAQSNISQLKVSAREHLEAGNYRLALNDLSRIHIFKPDHKPTLLKMAVCQYHLNQIGECHIKLLSLAQEGKTSDEDVWYYLGMVQQNLKQFEAAATSFKNYLKATKIEDDRRDEVKQALEACEYGKELVLQAPLAYIENLGSRINSVYDELYPILDESDGPRLFFTSGKNPLTTANEMLPFKTSVSDNYPYQSQLQSGEWSERESMSEIIGSEVSRYAICMGANKQFILKNDLKNKRNSFYTSCTEDENKFFANEQQFIAPVFPNKGDISLNLQNEHLILFSSKRPGGYGGYDIYFCLKEENTWQEPVNMGPGINSVYNEIDACLSKDGNRIYFSSDRKGSIGGYDIFVSDFIQENGIWSEVLNLGFPVNSPKDDRQLILSNDGSGGLLVSNRKTGSGGFDLYSVYWTSPIENQLIESKAEFPTFATMTKRIVDGGKKMPIRANQSISREDSLSPQKIITIDPIYFDENEMVLNEQTLDILSELVKVMNEYPNLELSLLSHGGSYDGPLYLDLYFSVRRAEQVVDFLKDRGISADRLRIMGFGGQIPYATTNDQPNARASMLEQLNRRIELKFHGVEAYKLDIQMVDPGLDSKMISPGYKAMNRKMQEITYKIQLASTDQVFKDEVLGSYDYPLVEKTSDGKYMYTVGWTNNYMEVQRMKLRLRSSGYSDAVIIPYLQGRRLNRQEVEALKDTYLELQIYLEN